MAHFAQIDNNNTVVQVIVADNKEWCENVLGGRWVQTSYNTIGGVHTTGGTPFRKNYAGIGYTYDPVRDAFIPPKPFDSWLLNEDSCLWEAPVAHPNDGKFYNWDEESLTWKEVVIDD
jgi:hypothetical protein